MDEGVLIKLRKKPSKWLKDKVYFIKNGEYVDMYITDYEGNPSTLGIGLENKNFIAETEQRLDDLEENTDGLHNGASYLDYYNLALK